MKIRVKTTFLHRLRNVRQRGMEPMAVLTVLLLIGIASAVAVAYWNGGKANAYSDQAKAQLDTIGNALELYNRETHTYPAGTAVNVTTTLLTTPAGTPELGTNGDPTDAGDSTRAAHFSYTNTTANNVQGWTVCSPAVHSAASLADLSGATTTSDKVCKTSSGNVYAAT